MFLSELAATSLILAALHVYSFTPDQVFFDGRCQHIDEGLAGLVMRCQHVDADLRVLGMRCYRFNAGRATFGLCSWSILVDPASLYAYAFAFVCAPSLVQDQALHAGHGTWQAWQVASADGRFGALHAAG